MINSLNTEEIIEILNDNNFTTKVSNGTIVITKMCKRVDNRLIYNYKKNDVATWRNILIELLREHNIRL